MMEAARVHRFEKGSGLPIKAPVIDMIEIGAGGGSIAAIDEVGLLKVGPHSAGADPGPACYGRGGDEPTVTDANLVLGYYDPGFFLGGRMALDLDGGRSARSRRVARAARPVGRAGGLGHPQGRGREHGGGGARPSRREGQGSAPLRDGRLRRRRSRACGRRRARARRPRGDHPAGLRRGLGARLPRGAAVLRAGALAARSSFAERFRRGGGQRPAGELEAEGRRRLAEAGIAPAGDHGRAQRRHAPRRPDARHLRAAAGRTDRRGEPAGASARPSSSAYSARYTSPSTRARGSRRSPSACAASGRRRRSRLPAPPAAATREAKVKGTAGPGSTAELAEAASTTATRCVPATRSPGRPSSRSAKRRPSCRPVTSSTVDDGLNLRIAVGARRPAEALVTPDMPLEPRRYARIEADPIALEIMWSRLITVVEEMWLTVCRTAFSLIISEAQDFACELLDPRRRDAGAFAPRHAGLQPHPAARREGAARTLSGRDAAARRRAGHQRSLALRRPPVRHRRGDAGLPGRPPRRADGHGRPRLRHRRHQAIRCTPARSTRKASRSRR